MLRVWLIGLLVFLFVPIRAQESFHSPPRFQALGNASVSLQSPLSIFSNPAGFSSHDKVSLGLSYESRFSLNDLQTASAFGVFPLAGSWFGASFSQFGNQSYHENKWSVGIAKQLSARLRAGIQFHYLSIFLVENDERPAYLLADFGVQYAFKNGVIVGAQLFNPNELQFFKGNLTNSQPLVIRLGVHQTFGEAVLLAVELYQQEEKVTGARAGIELNLKRQFQCRVGIDSQLSLFTMGLGYSVKHFQFDIAFAHHRYLGYSPSFSVYYNWP
ncbi:PorV/PorQ family protein [Sunxiuqinia elliptica]|uniref:Type IX secretion system membrane protein PorP/SprF n=1 Tax=Sunxiuqinia elliptica TaxID=655355 RepID=A0A1I2EAR0_9BACT|nr:hypothetical protein [Sunxiuqinia elliptica]SFE89330.1 hypothetical protein SAMN05216283_10213 [Sunxiuqinia elliptica]